MTLSLRAESGGTSGTFLVDANQSFNFDQSGVVTQGGVTLSGTNGFSKLLIVTSSQLWTLPTGINRIKVTVVGGGGSGYIVTHRVYGTGVQAGSGGGGGCAVKYLQGLSLNQVFNITVGAPKGTSSFDKYCSATGGSNAYDNGLYVQPGQFAGGTGGIGIGGDINISGQDGGATYATLFQSSNSGYPLYIANYDILEAYNLQAGKSFLGSNPFMQGAYGNGGHGSAAPIGEVLGQPGVVLIEY